jgi:hypothetical protein
LFSASRKADGATVSQRAGLGSPKGEDCRASARSAIRLTSGAAHVDSHARDLAARGEWAQAIPDPLGGVSNPICDLTRVSPFSDLARREFHGEDAAEFAA